MTPPTLMDTSELPRHCWEKRIKKRRKRRERRRVLSSYVSWIHHVGSSGYKKLKEGNHKKNKNKGGVTLNSSRNIISNEHISSVTTNYPRHWRLHLYRLAFDVMVTAAFASSRIIRFGILYSLCSLCCGWWLVLICCERKVLLAGWCWFGVREKTLLTWEWKLWILTIHIIESDI